MSTAVPRLRGGQKAETPVFLLIETGPLRGSFQLRHEVITELSVTFVNSVFLP